MSIVVLRVIEAERGREVYFRFGALCHRHGSFGVFGRRGSSGTGGFLAPPVALDPRGHLEVCVLGVVGRVVGDPYFGFGFGGFSTPVVS